MVKKFEDELLIDMEKRKIYVRTKTDELIVVVDEQEDSDEYHRVKRFIDSTNTTLDRLRKNQESKIDLVRSA
jgi:hypothetical protein